MQRLLDFLQPLLDGLQRAFPRRLAPAPARARWSAWLRGRARGQTLVEFALALPVFIMMLLGIVEFSRLFFAYIAINTSSREAVRYAASVGLSGGVPRYKDCTGIHQAAVRGGFLLTVTSEIRTDTGPDDTRAFSSLPVCGTMSYDPKNGNRIVVKTTATFTSPFLSSFNLSSTSVRTLVRDVELEVN